MCKCQNCLAGNKHNFDNMSENLQADTPQARAKARLMSLLYIFFAFLKYCGLFFLGLMTGGGIVLKNPPEDKNAKKQIVELTQQNENLKNDLLQVKNANKPNDKPIEKLTVVLD